MVVGSAAVSRQCGGAGEAADAFVLVAVSRSCQLDSRSTIGIAFNQPQRQFGSTSADQETSFDLYPRGKATLDQVSPAGAIVGGSAGGLALFAIVIGFLCYCKLRRRNSSNKNSETGSSDPSTLAAEWNKGSRISSSGCGPPIEHHGARQFTLQELEQATKNFRECNLVGSGSFGLVYKGLLLDGTVVAIKRRPGAPRREFVEEVNSLAAILHRNLVTLIGYCQEGGLQMLVSEYLPNGSVSGHLYDTGQDSTARLEFKQRLSIAIGAAKGLSHLHSRTPPFVHKDFKTSSVLVDENFIAKVADAGIVRLLQTVEDVGPSQTSAGNVFRDPEVCELGALRETGDVYSFGVFLLELITGQEAARLNFPLSNESLAQWAEEQLISDDLFDRRLGRSFTSEGMKELIGLTIQCLNLSGIRRPKMETIVVELDRILETEMTLTTVMGDGTTIFIPGSQLFTS